MKMEEHRNVGSRVILGMILIAIGIIYLLKSFYFPIDIEIFSFPFILIVIGIIIMLNSGNKLFGAIVFIFGLLLYFGDHITIWPFFFILWGIYIIFKHRNRRPRIFENPQPISNPDEKKDFRDDIADFVKSEKKHFYDSSIRKDYIDDISIFGGGHKVIHSDSFKGGNITAIFGGSEIDLTQCKLAPGDNYIDVVIIFGGTTIVVPNNWDVILNVTPLFGGFSNKKSRYVSSGTEPSGTLIIKGVVLFGGGEIKSY
jgi:predicted membrane protein